MAFYSYSLTSTASGMTGGSGQPPNRPGTIRSLTFNNPLSSAVTVKLYDTSSASTLTTAIAEYHSFAYVSALAFGFYEYGTTPRDAVGTPFFEAPPGTFNPPDASPTGTGLPSDVAAEAQDYQALTGVYTLRKYGGQKVVDTTVAANATTPLVPFFVIIVPISSTVVTVDGGPFAYISGVAGKTDNASAITVVANID